ncbi:hypothetical protein K438DRAFT_1981399 [Mycena galopus ATCC 62051]|nr:hypothetical protein K438DRAFT_1981399 [Mycena galopus ATCC 62051]
MAKAPALSSHAKRNPGKAVQSPRKRKRPADLQGLKALSVARRLQKRISLNADTDAWFTEREEKSRSWRKARQNVPFIRSCSATRFGEEEGDDSGLHDVDDDLSGEAYKRGARATNKAAALDALQTANRVGEVMIDLFERTNVRAIGLFTRGNPDDSAVPYIVDSDYSRAFFAEVVKWTTPTSCVNSSREHERNDLDSVRKEIAQIILDTLRGLKNNQKLLMDYVNYLVVIVHGLGVRLAGWPDSIAMVRPSKLSADDARIIRAKLRSGAIKWVVLSKRERDSVAREVDALREQGPLRPQKERSDKGSKRGPYKKRGAKGGDDGEDESEDDNEESPSGGVSSSSAPPAASASTASCPPAASTSTASASPAASTSTASASPAASVSMALVPPAASVSTGSMPPAASASTVTPLPAASPSVALPAAFVPYPAEQGGVLGSISPNYYDPYAIDYEQLNYGLMDLEPFPSGEPLIPASWDLMITPNGPLHSMDNDARGSETAGLRLNTSNVDEDVTPVASSRSAQAPAAQTIPPSSSTSMPAKRKRARKENTEGEKVPKAPRKKRSDAGVKKGPRNARQ